MALKNILLFVDESAEYGRGLLSGIAEYSHVHGPWMFLRRHRRTTRPLVGKKGLPDLQNIDGIITYEIKRIKPLLETNIPIALSFNKLSPDRIPPRKNLINMMSDDQKIGEMAAEHFISRGFRHFGFCGYWDSPWVDKRMEGFRECLHKNNLELSVYHPPKTHQQQIWQNEKRHIIEWLRSLPKPHAILACNDRRGDEVIESCNAAGIMVPEEVAVLGVDNDQTCCELSTPPLSSIAMNTKPAGYEAARQLDIMMSGGTVENNFICVEPSHIISRQSTNILAVEDEEIAEAVRYIRDHIRNNVHVLDIVEELAIPRRTLERRFRKATGRTINESIIQTRLDLVCRLLTQSKETIDTISRTVGYEQASDLTRMFKKKMNITPLAYRKKYGSS